jgi:hypothetical protein
MPRALDHRLPQPLTPRDRAAYYAIGLTPGDLDHRRTPGQDFPVPHEARRSRLLALTNRARAIAAKWRKP